MDTTSNDFGIDLANFDIRDFVREGEGNSLFDEQADKTRQQQQQPQQQRSHQNMNTGYYGYPPAPSDLSANNSNNIGGLSMPTAPLSLEQLNALLNMGIGQATLERDGASTANTSQLQADQLKEQLAQQIKLQQLQQLQNQILQQQIQLLTAGARGITNKEVQQLLTPASTDIRSASQSTQVSPNILPPGMFHGMNMPSPHLHPANRIQHAHFNSHSTMSAPASLAFEMPGHPQGGPQSPASDFLTPLTSPVFPAEGPRRGKRGSEPFVGQYNDGANGAGARKRLAHSDSYGNLGLNMSMGTVSPALLSRLPRQRSRNNLSVDGGSMDTPSPIDLSMPPPSGPNSMFHTQSHSMSMGSSMGGEMPLTIHVSEHHRPPSGPPSSATSTAATSTTNVSPDLMPATPSLIMNMSGLSLPPGLVPPMDQSGRREQDKPGGAGGAAAQQQHPSAEAENPSQTQTRRGKMATRSRALSTSATATVNAASSTTSKPRRSTAGTSTRGTSAGVRNSGGGGSISSLPGPKIKSTHKDAEQKRRDSLKTSFDELRLLLPPIPLSSSTATGPLAGLGLGGDDSDDPPLPGAMPPRGPPRGEGDGPNKGVSKLVLLRCGNEFIRDLVGRVGRRDEEIVRQRQELKRLRTMLGMPSIDELERDLEKEDEWYREERRRARKKKQEEEDRDEGMAD
ncbi:hypothetical protein M408DRAFT_10788 [Serendipita vermifera MAFF 305830]|uniref:BHLH domain-containing protein n=1 Tax=Serendipita vermifera MAFF 305830 TaxID=933852 RepID=A0A0C3AZT2_SERVB|nr:hypothetical protein M408DRAFT_10788 [Serendipita vermifera MAFF 305830]